jgi:hypothetical protein
MIVAIGFFELILIVHHGCIFWPLCLLAFLYHFYNDFRGSKQCVHVEGKGVVCYFAFVEIVRERKVRP